MNLLIIKDTRILMSKDIINAGNTKQVMPKRYNIHDGKCLFPITIHGIGMAWGYPAQIKYGDSYGCLELLKGRTDLVLLRCGNGKELTHPLTVPVGKGTQLVYGSDSHIDNVANTYLELMPDASLEEILEKLCEHETAFYDRYFITDIKDLLATIDWGDKDASN